MTNESGHQEMKFWLKSEDGQKFSISQVAAAQSKVLADFEDLTSSTEDNPLPISISSGFALKKIIEFCESHKGEAFIPKEEYEDPRISLTADDEAYLDVTVDQLLAILEAANYLDIPALMEIITQKIANMATGATIDELCAKYGIKNDFEAEEEAELKRRFNGDH